MPKAQLVVRAAWPVAIIGLLTAHALAAPILVPFDTTVSPSDPLKFTVMNPHGGTINPVEQLVVEAYLITGGLGVPKIVLSHKLNAAGRSVGVFDIYLDSATTVIAPPTFDVMFYVTFLSSVPRQLYAESTLNSPEVQAGYLAFDYHSPGPSFVNHDFTARITPASGLSFVSTPRIQFFPPPKFKAFYFLGANSPNVILDPTKPLLSIEMSVTGVPEPGSVALAAMSFVAFAGFAARRLRLTEKSAP